MTFEVPLINRTGRKSLLLTAKSKAGSAADTGYVIELLCEDQKSYCFSLSKGASVLTGEILSKNMDVRMTLPILFSLLKRFVCVNTLKLWLLFDVKSSNTDWCIGV